MSADDRITREYLISVVRRVKKKDEYLYIDDCDLYLSPRAIYVRYSMWPGGAFSQSFTLSWNQREAEMVWYPYVVNPALHRVRFDLAEPKSVSLRHAIRARFNDVKIYQQRGFRYVQD